MSSAACWFFSISAKSDDAFRKVSDREIMSVFANHRATFDRLQQMVIGDSLKEHYFSKSHLQSSLGASRQQEYRLQFNKINADISVTVSGRSVRFIFSNNGKFAIGPSSIKGIEYIRSKIGGEGVLRDNLDKPESMPAGEIYLRKIEPDWFVFVQNID